MGWILFYGSDLRDRDRLERAAAAARLEVRPYSPGSWEAIEEPELVVIDLDRAGVPENLPEAVRAIGYYSHVDAETARRAEAADIVAIPRGRFWPDLDRLIRDL
ncbi:MAG: hypothetical protein KY391_08205 [Actinobacteria bacterium]|nr:hypothetical protein [Actinomycetota bacterium]